MKAASDVLSRISPRISRLRAALDHHKAAPFRLSQAVNAMYPAGSEKRPVQSWMEVSGWPVALREQVGEHLKQSSILALTPAMHSESSQAHKIMFELDDGNRIEAVRMSFRNGKNSLCISSQSGCALACNFCATGAIGLKRQLTSDEVADQVLYFLQRGHSIDSVAFMGMGEPLANPHVFRAISQLTHPKMFAFSPRRISVSTVGIVQGIRKLTREHPQVNLAFSLHSPFEEERSALMPIGKVNPLGSVFEAIDEHIQTTGRRVFIAYLVLEGFNDSEKHARGVMEWVRHKRPQEVRDKLHINVLRFNPIGQEEMDEVLSVPTGETIRSRSGAELEVEGMPSPFYRRTTPHGIERFEGLLRKFGAKSITLRQSFGLDIDAACGQLYAAYEKKAAATS